MYSNTMIQNYTPLQLEETPEEEHELKQYRITPKFNEWVRLYTTRNTPTYHNATESALQAYPGIAYSTAKQIGHRNITKCNFLGREYMESKGLTFEKMIDIGATAMVKVDKEGKIIEVSEKWWDRLMEIAGYKKLSESHIVQNNQYIGSQTNVQNNVTVTKEQQEQFNSKFIEFIEHETTT